MILLVLLLIFPVFFKIQTQGKLIVTPKDQTVTTGSAVRLQCSTNSEGGSVTWRHAYIGDVRPSDVYKSGNLLNGYVQRYRVDTSSRGQFDLVVKDSQVDDSGEYYCSENYVDGETASAQLRVQVFTKDFTAVPENTTAIAGQNVRLACGSAYFKNVWWLRRSIGTDKDVPMYYGNRGLVNGFRTDRRYRVDANDTSGRYDLLIDNVQSRDAGKYYCIDESGIGNKVMAELTVLESTPMCSLSIPSDGLVGVNSCGLEPDEVSMTCEVNFKGNIPPSLKWRRSNEGNDVSSGSTNSEKVFVFTESSAKATLKLMASSNDWATYECQTNTFSSSGNQCKPSSNVKTIYVSNFTTSYQVNEGQESVNCFANTSQTCKYSWIQRKENGDDLIADGQTLNLTNVGHYWCKAECGIRGRQCTVYPMHVELRFTDTVSENQEKSKTNVIAVVVLCAVAAIIGLVLGLVLVLVVRRRMNSLKFWKKGNAPCDFDNNIINIYKLTNDAKYGMKSLTILQKHLYAIFENSNKIYVYSGEQPFNRINVIPIPQLKTPEDIVACNKSNFLYVSDSHETGCIWKVSVRYKFTFQVGEIQIFASNVNSTCMLSVTKRGNVLLVREKEGDRLSSIDIFNEQGKKIKNISLMSDQESLKHAVLMSLISDREPLKPDVLLDEDDRFIVSFGARIGKVDKLGNILNSYPLSSDPAINTDEPLYIVLDKDNRTFLTDFRNKKIFVLDKELREIDVIKMTELKEDQKCLHTFVVNKNQLIIGLASGEVLVLDIAKAKQDRQSRVIYREEERPLADPLHE